MTAFPRSAKHLRTTSNVFVIHLALADFLMMAKTPIFIQNSFSEGPVWGKLGCNFYAVVGAYSGIGAALTNALIAFDRYKYPSGLFGGRKAEAKLLFDI